LAWNWKQNSPKLMILHEIRHFIATHACFFKTCHVTLSSLRISCLSVESPPLNFLWIFSLKHTLLVSYYLAGRMVTIFATCRYGDSCSAFIFGQTNAHILLYCIYSMVTVVAKKYIVSFCGRSLVYSLLIGNVCLMTN